MWFAQVDAFDSLPPKPYDRSGRELTFSPSKADACLRELFYTHTNVPKDDTPQVSWKERRRRNGNAYHRETQREHRKMVDALRAAGRSDIVNFEILAVEIDGRATFNVGGVTVTLKGRADYIVRYVGETIPGVVTKGDVLVVDLKAKDKLSGVNGVQRKGVPPHTKAQMVAYSLLKFVTDDGTTFADIDKAIVHYESLQKNKEDEVAPKDVLCVEVHSTWDDQKAILVRLAEAVEHIESGTLPPAETTKCHFCEYKAICAKDGGYQFVAGRDVPFKVDSAIENERGDGS